MMTIMRLALWAAVLATGCKCRENVTPPATTPSKLPAVTPVDAAPATTVDAANAVTSDQPDAALALRVQALQPSDDDTLATLPTFAGGSVVRPGRRLRNDTQWVAVSCGPLDGTFELVRGNLRTQGWLEESHRDSDGIQTVTAQRNGLNVSIVVTRSKRADCAGATASITAFRLQR
ncbi:MAG: hypothetical protein KBG15_03285 [Kofleriaceae bacterium]|nr:hypothetical protein [Kofleriaceae bacterium]